MSIKTTLLTTASTAAKLNNHFTGGMLPLPYSKEKYYKLNNVNRTFKQSNSKEQ